MGSSLCLPTWGTELGGQRYELRTESGRTRPRRSRRNSPERPNISSACSLALGREPRPLTTIVSRVIRLSQLRVERGPAVAVLKVARDMREPRNCGRNAGWSPKLPTNRDSTTVGGNCCRGFWPSTNAPTRLCASSPTDPESIWPRYSPTPRPLRGADHRGARCHRAVAPCHGEVDRRGQPLLRSAMGRRAGVGLAEVCGRLDPGLMPKLERLEGMLARAIVGRRMTVCWTHGDYTPDSVRLAGPRGPVNRIVGWDKAREDRPALIDHVPDDLDRELPAQEADLRRRRQPTTHRRRAFRLRAECADAGTGRSGERCRDPERIDERVAILLAWLHHSAAVCRS